MLKKIILILISIVVLVILAFFFILGGGFGKKQISIESFLSDSLILFAHRGVTQFSPENSKQSLEESLEQGLNAVEIDIRQTKDNVFVLFHDVNCKRLLGKDALLSELTFNQVSKYPLLFQNKITDNYVLSLDEFFNQYSDLFVYLDTKTDGEKSKYEKADLLVKILKKHHVLSSTIVANADFLFLAYIEYHFPEVLTALEGFSKNKIWIYSLIPKNFKTDYLSSSYKDLTDEEIDWLKKNNLLSNRIIYHVDSKSLDKYLKQGITKIIFDYDTSFKFNYPNK